MPSAARKALRRHKENEAKIFQKKIEDEGREAAVVLLATKTLKGKRAKALQLYAGFDRLRWRSYAEVARMMHISKERVRQLLLPSKTTLSEQLSGRVPWKKTDKAHNQSNAKSKADPVCANCQNIQLRKLAEGSYLYQCCRSQTAILNGVMVRNCHRCARQSLWIPALSDLQKKIVRFVLLKPSRLTGDELRFIRTCAGLSRSDLSSHLGVTGQTIQYWERSQFLRYANDMAVRIVTGALIGADVYAELRDLLGVMKGRRENGNQISLCWNNSSTTWSMNPQV